MSDPSSERRQHDRIDRDESQIADANGASGWPWRVEGLLARLERHGDIGSRERMAGEEFGRLFRIAALDPLRAPDFAQPRNPESRDGHAGERARHQIDVAVKVLGGPLSITASCAWFVLGVELSVSQWAARQGWAGRPLRREVAKGILLATLAVLARHFGR